MVHSLPRVPDTALARIFRTPRKTFGGGLHATVRGDSSSAVHLRLLTKDTLRYEAHATGHPCRASSQRVRGFVRTAGVFPNSFRPNSKKSVPTAGPETGRGEEGRQVGLHPNQGEESDCSAS